MIKFEQERINKESITSKLFKQPIPVVWIQPRQVNEQTCVFIFCCGLGGTNSFNIYMNNSAYDNNYFVMYDKMGHGDNTNAPSQFKKKYLLELDEVVNWAQQQFPGKKIYLLGESWGCAVNFLYYQKFGNKINGVINWNMPTVPHSPAKKTPWQNWQFFWREFVTVVTNKDLQLPVEQNHHELLSRNTLLVRVMAMRPATKNSTRLTLAVWRYMRPSYKFLLKNCNNSKYNFLYIQSGQDALMNKKHIANITARADAQHYLALPTGYHILTMEPEESKDLYKAILEFVKKN